MADYRSSTPEGGKKQPFGSETVYEVLDFVVVTRYVLEGAGEGDQGSQCRTTLRAGSGTRCWRLRCWQNFFS
ncbi:unnamed protein product [Rhodiola kirilowii]